MKKIPCFAGLLLFIVFSSPLLASHLRSAEIIARPVDCNAFTYEITVVGYVNTASGVAFGGSASLLSFGDNQTLVLPELFPTVIDAELQVGKVEFKVFHTFPGQGVYRVSYREGNRNEGIINMAGSVTTTFYTETSIAIIPGHCNASPLLAVAPVDRACRGIAFYHNPGAIDPDDDSLSYAFVTPKQDRETFVNAFLPPASAPFYGSNFVVGNERQDGPPSMTINPEEGTLTWDAPGAIGEYAIALKVTEWRFNPEDSTWFEVGFVVRDMQIIVEDCNNRKPEVTTPEVFCVIAGTTIDFTANLSDPDGDPVVVEAISEILSLVESPGIIRPSGVVQQSTAPPNDTASVSFTWQTTCDHVKAQPYKLVLKITDRPPSGPRLVRFKTILIHVLGPAPEYENVSVNPITRHVELRWRNDACDNVKAFQVWRRVARYEYDQPQCEAGMPVAARYKLLAEVPHTASSYTDHNLSIGALYCYRIVALIGDLGIPGKISADTCLIPKPAEAPVITHVSVIKTDASAGEIFLRWTSPFDIDPLQYPPPYQYHVYRSPGMDEHGPFERVSPASLTDTVFHDVGINTLESPFVYKIELYVPSLTQSPVDTSSAASSVRLSTVSQPGSIQLTWNAYTPWYNYLQAFPYHLIYRGNNSGELALIDSVHVNESGFTYTDTGQSPSGPLQPDATYYYKVTTRGGYGNPNIPDPLLNDSQVDSNILLDTIPPCPPVATLQENNCQSYSCTGKNYFNTITWSNSGACADDVVAYNIYGRGVSETDFQLLATVTGQTYTQRGLASRAKCYQITAVDFAGNESNASGLVCSDNCPYFELPNVITPGSEDELNDLLMAFTSHSADTTKCARFVIAVDITIYDRWGTEVYSKKSQANADPFILWDGRSAAGLVSSGVYYYKADVLFDVADPGKKYKQLKGWVRVH